MLSKYWSEFAAFLEEEEDGGKPGMGGVRDTKARPPFAKIYLRKSSREKSIFAHTRSLQSQGKKFGVVVGPKGVTLSRPILRV